MSGATFGDRLRGSFLASEYDIEALAAAIDRDAAELRIDTAETSLAFEAEQRQHFRRRVQEAVERLSFVSTMPRAGYLISLVEADLLEEAVSEIFGEAPAKSELPAVCPECCWRVIKEELARPGEICDGCASSRVAAPAAYPMTTPPAPGNPWPPNGWKVNNPDWPAGDGPHLVPEDEELAWPLSDILRKLCDAADHLLRDHDCDRHGWEEIGHARDAGRRYLTQRERED